MADQAQFQTLYNQFKAALDKEDFVQAEKHFSALNQLIYSIDDFAQLDPSFLTTLQQFQQEIDPLTEQLQQNSRQLVAKLKPFNENRAKSYTSSKKRKYK